MNVLLFGRLSDLAGWRERSFDPGPASLAALKALLAAEDAALGAALDGRQDSAASRAAVGSRRTTAGAAVGDKRGHDDRATHLRNVRGCRP